MCDYTEEKVYKIEHITEEQIDYLEKNGYHKLISCVMPLSRSDKPTQEFSNAETFTIYVKNIDNFRDVWKALAHMKDISKGDVFVENLNWKGKGIKRKNKRGE